MFDAFNKTLSDTVSSVSAMAQDGLGNIRGGDGAAGRGRGEGRGGGEAGRGGAATGRGDKNTSITSSASNSSLIPPTRRGPSLKDSIDGQQGYERQAKEEGGEGGRAGGVVMEGLSIRRQLPDIPPFSKEKQYNLDVLASLSREDIVALLSTERQTAGMYYDLCREERSRMEQVREESDLNKKMRDELQRTIVQIENDSEKRLKRVQASAKRAQETCKQLENKVAEKREVIDALQGQVRYIYNII